MGFVVQPPIISSASAPNPTQINIAWTNGATYAATNGIKIQTGPNANGPTSSPIYLPGSSTSYQLTGLTEGSCLWIYVSGRMVYEGYEYWSEVDIYGPVYTRLLAPASLAATQIVDGECLLTWQAKSSKAQYQQAYKSTDGVNFSQVIGVLDDLVTSKKVTGLTEARYWFRVKCWNDNTESDWSNVAEAAKALAAPSNLVAAQLSSTSAKLTWKDNSTGETSFKVERSTSSSEYSFAQIATVGANQTSFTNTGLTPGTKYYYRVRAYEAVAGNSAYSNIANVTPQAVALPTNVEATALSSTSVRVSWVDNSNNETGFKIYQNGTLVYTTGENETSKTFTGLTPATWYKYQIEAFNATDASGKTAEVKVFTSDPPKA
ncbi:MAG: fibronectin type III domain-containing protein, partial [Syntrophales bacterium]|nr:fibronectin type III domain-containing protein [Syntrophales bacterium]